MERLEKFLITMILVMTAITFTFIMIGLIIVAAEASMPPNKIEGEYNITTTTRNIRLWND